MSDSNKLPFGIAMNFNTQDDNTGKVLQEKRDSPFCIAMMGDFSGQQGSVKKTNISDRNFIAIDRYDYDDVLASMGLQLSLPLDRDGNSTTVNVPLNSLKDFQPDRLYKNVDVFARLRGLRDRLNNPNTFKEAMEELGLQEDEGQASTQQDSVTTEKSRPQVSTEMSPEVSGGSLLDSILDETESPSGKSAESLPSAAATEQQSNSLVDVFIKQLVIKKTKKVSRDARQDELVASIDDEITQQMRSLLHNPQFQALEALWRAVQFLVKRIPGNNKIKLYLLDVSRDELALDLEVDDVTQSQLYKQFCDTQMGDTNWNLIIGDYRFGANIDDILELSQLGAIALQTGAKFIAGADEKLVGCTSFAETAKADNWLYESSQPIDEAWLLLRKSPVAKSIYLALPRFLLRTPYGAKGTRVETFAFEEMSDSPEHEDYLWGNAAFLKGEQLVRAFIESGWEMRFQNVMKTEDLPIHYYEEGGQTIVKPCAEIPLTDRGASKMIAQGLIPLWSVKNSDKVHSGDFHSIAE